MLADETEGKTVCPSEVHFLTVVLRLNQSCRTRPTSLQLSSSLCCSAQWVPTVDSSAPPTTQIKSSINILCILKVLFLCFYRWSGWRCDSKKGSEWWRHAWPDVERKAIRCFNGTILIYCCLFTGCSPVCKQPRSSFNRFVQLHIRIFRGNQSTKQPDISEKEKHFLCYSDKLQTE